MLSKGLVNLEKSVLATRVDIFVVWELLYSKTYKLVKFYAVDRQVK